MVGQREAQVNAPPVGPERPSIPAWMPRTITGRALHGAFKLTIETGHQPKPGIPMTTSMQPTVLTERELSALRLLSMDSRAKIDKTLEDDLFAKGMLQSAWDRALSPAGQHAIHIGRKGMVPGLDN